MVFGGLQKSSLIDFPGKISCVLFLSGCNFDCPYCHNPGLARGNSTPCFSEPGGLYDFLEGRKAFLEGVVISGGEPTLESDLFSLCARIKDMGYPVKLDTNGSRPGVLKRLMEEDLLDYVAMDIKTDPSLYAPFIRGDFNPEDILESIEILMGSDLPYEFRTTCVKPIVNEETIKNIAGIIQGARLYDLQGYHESEVLHPEFFQDINPRYDDEEMMVLKAVADPWVQECFIR
jgi:pyruvate formate lyase activating enzyme